MGDTPISSILPMTSPYDGPKDANKAPTSSRGNPSETIADVHPPQKESAELVIDQEGIIDSTLGGLNDIPVSVASPDSFSIGYIVSIFLSIYCEFFFFFIIYYALTFFVFRVRR